jgi:hypothetical protein
MYAPPMQAGMPNAYGPVQQGYGGNIYGGITPTINGGYGTMPMPTFNQSLGFVDPMATTAFAMQPMNNGSFGNFNYPQMGYGVTPPTAMPVQTMGMNQPGMIQQGFSTTAMTSTYYPSAAEIGISNPFATPIPGTPAVQPQGGYPPAQQGPMPIAMDIPGMSGVSPQMNAAPWMSPMEQQMISPTDQSFMYDLQNFGGSSADHSLGGLSAAESRMSALEQRMLTELMRDPELAILWMLVQKTQSKAPETILVPTPETEMPTPNTDLLYADDMGSTQLPSLNTVDDFSIMQPQTNPYAPEGYDAGSLMDPSRYDGAYGSSASLYNSTPLSKALDTYRSTFQPGFSMNGELTASAKEAASLQETDTTTSTNGTTPPDNTTTTTAPAPSPAPPPTTTA